MNRQAAGPGGWYRVFATTYAPAQDGPGGSVAVLVDTEPFFAPLKLISTRSEVRRLLLGAHGVPMPMSDARLTEWHDRLEGEADRVPAFAALVRHLLESEPGQGTCVAPWWPATVVPSEERHAV